MSDRAPHPVPHDPYASPPPTRPEPARRGGGPVPWIISLALVKNRDGRYQLAKAILADLKL